MSKLPTKREYVDDYRMQMDKYRYKWAGYQRKALAQNSTDECDYQCAAGCFAGQFQTTAAEKIFFECLAPKCHCIRSLLSQRAIMDI
jgi:hypothetical protein